MTRLEAIEEFKQKCCVNKDEIKDDFMTGLETGMDELIKRISAAFGEIADQAEAKGKAACAFFIFSLLRYDLMQNKARVRLDVMNGGWYSDKEPLCTEFDLTFLFTPYFQWRETLLTAMREYMGKVNRYDVEAIVQEEIMEAVRPLIQILRIAFRNIEANDNFARIPKLAFWEIHFGEYRDYSEPIIQMNREPRSEEMWINKLEDYEENPAILQFSWWYRAVLRKGDCKEKNLCGIVFEGCSLQNIDFEKAKLMGARFLSCSLEQCNFKQADLTQAEFERCTFTDCTFTDAGMQQAVFSLEGLKAEWFDEKQMQEMLIVEGVAS